MRNQKKKKGKRPKNTNRLGIVSIILVVAMLSIILSTKMHDLYQKNQELNVKKADLQTLLDEQYQREEDLDEQRVYVKTKKYIEEKARELGYIYPDEIIFKPNK